jgi:hypothetical protein
MGGGERNVIDPTSAKSQEWGGRQRTVTIKSNYGSDRGFVAFEVLTAVVRGGDCGARSLNDRHLSLIMLPSRLVLPLARHHHQRRSARIQR